MVIPETEKHCASADSRVITRRAWSMIPLDVQELDVFRLPSTQQPSIGEHSVAALRSFKNCAVFEVRDDSCYDI